jgi:hypothetical protein
MPWLWLFASKAGGFFALWARPLAAGLAGRLLAGHRCHRYPLYPGTKALIVDGWLNVGGLRRFSRAYGWGCKTHYVVRKQILNKSGCGFLGPPAGDRSGSRPVRKRKAFIHSLLGCTGKSGPLHFASIDFLLEHLRVGGRPRWQNGRMGLRTPRDSRCSDVFSFVS